MAKKLSGPSPKTTDALRRVLTLPGVATIVRLARECEHLLSKSSDHSARASKLINETKHIHKGAFRLGMRFSDMEEKKRAIFLAHFDHIRDVLKLDEIKQKDFDFTDEGKDKKKKKNGDVEAKAGLSADDRAAEAADLAAAGEDGDGDRPIAH